MPKFIVQHEGVESVAELKPGANSIGRQSTCSIPLKDSTLSRLHCEVILAGNVATLLDKGSRNGTLLNGKKIEAQVLQPGDKIQIGATTLWYEKMNVAVERKEPTGTARAVAPSATPVPAPSTRRKPPPPAPAPASVAPADAEAASQAAGLLSDYAFHGPAGGVFGKLAAAVLLLAILGGAAYAGSAYLRLPEKSVDESDNLIARHAHFEAGSGNRPDGWQMRPSMTGEKPSASASVDASRGRGKSACLLLEKSAGGGDLVAECGYVDDLLIPKGAGLDASVFTQFEGFSGWAAIKIEWLKAPKGPVLAEECSDPVSKCSEWTEIRASFVPPSGAAAFRLALMIVGRGGRAFFDDAAVKLRNGATPPPDKKIGAHRISATRQGVLQVELRGGRRTLGNISVRLENDKEGMTPQIFSTDVALSADENGLAFAGRLFNPLDFRELPFEERVASVDGLTNVFYQFRGDALKQVDRVSISLTLPRVDGPPRGVSESGDPTMRITCGSEDGDFAIEYVDPARVKVRQVDGRFRVTQTWTVDPAAEDPAFGFRIREQGGTGPLDPQAAISEFRAQRKYGEALLLARDQAKKVREVPVREKLEAEIRSLEDLERHDWAEAQAYAFQARVSRRGELVAKCFEKLDAYLRQWAGEGGEAKAQTLRGEIEKDLASTADTESERPRRIFERAKKCIEIGKRTLAQTLLQTLVARYPASPVSAEAQTLLRTLSE